MSNGIFTLDPDKLRKFTDSLRDKSEEELRDIITKYINYLPEMAEAALIVSVDRGFISYDMKSKLSNQIMTNFEFHGKGIKPHGWEKENAFREYVSKYSDDDLYQFIDQPSNIVIDVYNAILAEAEQRELISGTDKSDFSEDAIKSARSEDEIKMDEFREFTKDIMATEPEEELTEEQIEEEKKKYWVCPNCHELVEMEMAVCWKCQTVAPEVIEHPGKEEVIKELEIRKPFSFTKTGITLISLGVVLVAVGILHKILPGHYFHWFRWDGIIIGGVSLFFGVASLIRGASKSDN